MRTWLLTLTLLAAVPASAQSVVLEPFWPGTTYDPAIPTLRQVVGHDPGTEITSPEQIGVYLQALQKADPTRTRLVEYARSWEGRPLWLLVVGAPARIAALDAVKADLQRLADPRGLSASDQQRLVQQNPVVVWLAHGVHGNEISSADAALLEAYHLLAARGDADVDLILREALVLIDPMQNPDGRARFLFQNLQGRAAHLDPVPYNAEHDEPWPGGRSNHYLFDMNRDWFAQTQPESRGRVRVGREYWPQVTVDLHEQGGDNHYFFPPPADPINPHLTRSQLASLEMFGRANAERFDQRGWSYYIRDVYDAFYPGYGDSWPTAHGSIGMTYEQPSARALAFARRDGTVMTYRDGVMHHFNAAIVTARTAARNRERLLRNFLEFRQTAITDGEQSQAREYVLLPGHDPSRAAALARNLATQGIAVRQTTAPTKVGTREVPAGAYVVAHAQPAGRLVRNLLDTTVPLPEAFVQAQEARRARRLSDEIYDITAWSLPLLYDVEVVTSAVPLAVAATPVPDTYDAPPAPRTFARGQVGYLLPWGSATAALTAEALAEGLRVTSIGGSFTLQGRTYPIGTALVRHAGHPADLHERLQRLATRHGADVVPIDSAFIDRGVSLGGNDTAALRAPRVVLAWDAPTQSLSAGWTRYVLERRYGQRVTAVRVSALGRVVWSDVDVLVLPSGNYSGAIGEAVLARIRDWVRSGGTLITLAEATRWATSEGVALLSTKPLLKNGNLDMPGNVAAAGQGRETPAKPADAAAFNYDAAIHPERERPDAQPGALLRVRIDTEHWLSAGHDGEGAAMIEGSRVFAPLKLDSGRNVGVYATRDRLIASGLIWPENQGLLVEKAFLMHQPLGQGHIIGFAEEATYRAFSEGTMLLFMNAVLLGPGY